MTTWSRRPGGGARRGPDRRGRAEQRQPRQAAGYRPGTDIACVQNLFHLAERSAAPWSSAGVPEPWNRVRALLPAAGRAATPTRCLDLVNRAAARLGATPAQVALQWLLQLAPNVLPISGTASLAHLRDNLAAENVTLDDEARATLDRVIALERLQIPATARPRAPYSCRSPNISMRMDPWSRPPTWTGS